jgi:hypothetical protein
MVTDANKVYMKRLNPHNVNEEIMTTLFPQSNDFYNTIKGETFKVFWVYDGTTVKGQNATALHYNVLDKWNALNHEGDFVYIYYELVLLVKMKSINDNMWISFIEGPHRHAAIIACLLCTKFDYFNNILLPGSLEIPKFERAKIPNFKKPDLTPRHQLTLTDNNHEDTSMLIFSFKHTFQRVLVVT